MLKSSSLPITITYFTTKGWFPLGFLRRVSASHTARFAQRRPKSIHGQPEQCEQALIVSCAHGGPGSPPENWSLRILITYLQWPGVNRRDPSS
jgi:hypothetical protein